MWVSYLLLSQQQTIDMKGQARELEHIPVFLKNFAPQTSIVGISCCEAHNQQQELEDKQFTQIRKTNNMLNN